MQECALVLRQPSASDMASPPVRPRPGGAGDLDRVLRWRRAATGV